MTCRKVMISAPVHRDMAWRNRWPGETLSASAIVADEGNRDKQEDRRQISRLKRKRRAVLKKEKGEESQID